MIKTTTEMDFTGRNFTVIVAGAPGLGKTTLALSAPNPLLFDLDNGIARVRAEHRKITSVCETYEELLSDMKSEEYKNAATIVLDTGGSLVQMMQPWAKTQEPKAARDGRAMFGVVKREFDRLTWQIRQDGKNVVIVFHTTEVQKGDVTVTRLSCEGSAKDIVWTPADFGGTMFQRGKKRIICFAPTEEAFGKGCFGIHGEYEVPELAPGMPNTFLTDLFEQARKNIADEQEKFSKDKKIYDDAVREGTLCIDSVKCADDATACVARLREITHALTSKAELSGKLQNKVNALKLRWDKQSGKYVQI
jgi:hypothetical protein